MRRPGTRALGPSPPPVEQAAHPVLTQAEYKELVNSRQRQAAADAAVSSGAVSNEFIACELGLRD